MRTDLARALRALVAFVVPLTIWHGLHQPAEAVFISMAALNLSLPDLRGAYLARLGILGTMTLVAASSAWLGVWCAGSTVWAVLGMGGVALGGGLWRHLSADYGPSMAVSSGLLFLLGLSQLGGGPSAFHLAGLTALGGIFATLVQGCAWLFRPQHALRYAVAETWVAASDLVAAMRPGSGPDRNANSRSVARLERELRAALDRTFIILGGAENRKRAALITDLEEMRREVVHFTMRVIAFNTSLEPLLDQPGFAPCLPVTDSVLKALSDAARSTAITLITHRAANLAATRVRWRRGQHLIKVFDEQVAAVPAGGVAVAQARATLAKVGEALPQVQAALAKTADRVLPRPTLAQALPDISGLPIRSLGSWMRPASRPDPLLVRHVARMAVFTMVAVALYQGFGIPRGSWIAFTILVVLQPDYGSTRQRAAARTGGTLGGSLLAGGLLWTPMSLLLLDGLAATTAFAFAYFLKRRYWLAIFFITFNLMLITERLSALHPAVLVDRVLCTLLGGGLALVAARLFWPVWEGAQFPVLLAAAVRANRTFLLALFGGFGSPPAVNDPLLARRRAENANRNVAASVERLVGEPERSPEAVERAAALATYCQRVTRALTVLAVHLPDAGRLENPAVTAKFKAIADLLERLAQVVEAGSNESAVEQLAADLAALEGEFAKMVLPTDSATDPMTSGVGLIWGQMGKTIAELRAMTLALKMGATATDTSQK